MPPDQQSSTQPEKLGHAVRIGLALSGGGFRASIFHLGAIRRLEELGLMEKVEVISTVSGGSIAGVYYAIEMERCLQSKSPPSRLEAWNAISQRFLAAMDHNLRSRALLFAPVYHPWLFVKSTLLASFRRGARSLLIQEEYDRWFFHGNTLDELPSVVKAEGPHRVSGSKLVINTTSLLTGERKAFERDANSRLAEMRTSNKNVLKLSQVVGASAGVPVLFPPTPIAGDLLVDGGVADNQGIEGLADAKCTHLIISDACGQLELDHNPSTAETSVLLRVNSVLQHQVRNKLMRYLDEAKRRILKPALGADNSDHPIETGKFQFAFFHLYFNLKDAPAVTHRLPTRYIQPVARIRTDLDQFSHVEREALMYHGYTLADALIRRWCDEIYPDNPPPLRTAPLFETCRASDCGANGKDILKKHLEAGAEGMLIVRSWRKFKGPTALVLALYAGAFLLIGPLILALYGHLTQGAGDWVAGALLGSARSALGSVLDVLTRYIEFAAATNGWVDGKVVDTLRASIESAPQHLANLIGLVLAVALSLYVVFIPFWIWLHRWSLKLDREAYRKLAGQDWSLGWSEETGATGDEGLGGSSGLTNP